MNLAIARLTDISYCLLYRLPSMNNVKNEKVIMTINNCQIKL